MIKPLIQCPSCNRVYAPGHKCSGRASIKPAEPFTPEFIAERVAKEPTPDCQAVRKLALSLASAIRGTGISDGEALRIADEAARHPLVLAIALHKASSEFLSFASKTGE